MMTDILKCDWCGISVRRKDTMIMDTEKGRARFCRDCQFKKYMQELKDKNPGVDIGLRMEKFSKDLKDGIDGR